jgi:hypothetical protein
METIVSPKRRDHSPTPGGDILEDVVDSSTRRSLRTSYMVFELHRSLKVSWLLAVKPRFRVVGRRESLYWRIG